MGERASEGCCRGSRSWRLCSNRSSEGHWIDPESYIISPQAPKTSLHQRCRLKKGRGADDCSWEKHSTVGSLSSGRLCDATERLDRCNIKWHDVRLGRGKISSAILQQCSIWTCGLEGDTHDGTNRLSGVHCTTCSAQAKYVGSCRGSQGDFVSLGTGRF